MNFNKRSWIVGLVAVCLVAAGVAVWGDFLVAPVKTKSVPYAGDPYTVEIYFAAIDPEIGTLKDSLRKALRSGAIKAEDFEKLDFSMPGDPAYGDNPDDEVFNPEGKIKARPVGQGLMDMVMTVKGVRPIYNIQRYLDSGKIEEDTLILLIPNATDSSRKNLCSPSAKSKILPVHVYTDNSRPGELIDTAKWGGTGIHAGCTLSDDGRVYYVYSLVSRTRPPDRATWKTP